jgi:ABC-type uncharacterized transport system involved in gliding motility auxiliary subunit
MQVTQSSRRLTRLNNVLFVVLLLGVVGLLAWVSTRYNYEADWTANARHSLSPASVKLLQQAKGPITVTAFARGTQQLRDHIRDMIGRYQRYKSDISLSFVNPDTDPSRAQAMGVTTDGEIVIDYAGRKEHLKPFELKEQNITNALQRLLRSGDRWLVFLEGHGERSIEGQANNGLSLWVKQLEDKGFKVRSIDLAQAGSIPDNTTVLVISTPQVDLLPGEVKAIEDYVGRGGNLLWLGDPGSLHGLQPVAKELGVKFLPGIVVDPTAQVLGIRSAAIAAVTSYGASPVTKDFRLLTLFPLAAGMSITAPKGWQGDGFLKTGASSWVETGKLTGQVKFDENQDIRGPVTIGETLTRTPPDQAADKAKATAHHGKQQRVIVTGDGDFLANEYVGNVGNLDLGMNMVNWLSEDEHFLDIPAKTALDTSLRLSSMQSGVIGFGFLFGLPAVLLVSGLTIWLRRRKR